VKKLSAGANSLDQLTGSLDLPITIHSAAASARLVWSCAYCLGHELASN